MAALATLRTATGTATLRRAVAADLPAIVALVTWAVAEARRRGCTVVQLTSDTTRTDARRFHADLGSTASHVGFERTLWFRVSRRTTPLTSPLQVDVAQPVPIGQR